MTLVIGICQDCGNGSNVLEGRCTPCNLADMDRRHAAWKPEGQVKP